MINLQIISHCQNEIYLSTHPNEDIWFITEDGKTKQCRDLEEANDLFLTHSKKLLDKKYWDCYKVKK